jgi:hypothetical protein
LNLDSEPGEAVLKEMLADKDITAVRVVKI